MRLPLASLTAAYKRKAFGGSVAWQSSKKMKIERINAEITRELSSLIARSIKDPRLEGALISIMRANTTGDLKYCNVRISVMNAQNPKEIIEILNNSAPYLKKELFKRLKVRTVPDLKFHLDEGLEYGFKIEGILKDL
jgi:ribosome-binding factor A